MLGAQPPNSYLTAGKVVERLEKLAAPGPVREGVQVHRRRRFRANHRKRNRGGPCRTVVVATGGENMPRTRPVRRQRRGQRRRRGRVRRPTSGDDRRVHRPHGSPRAAGRTRQRRRARPVAPTERYRPAYRRVGDLVHRVHRRLLLARPRLARRDGPTPALRRCGCRARTVVRRAAVVHAPRLGELPGIPADAATVADAVRALGVAGD